MGCLNRVLVGAKRGVYAMILDGSNLVGINET